MSSLALGLACAPLTLVRIALLLSVRTATVVTLAWWHLVKAVVVLHLRVGWEIMVWSVASVTLPLRLLDALDREGKLERLVNEMQCQMERFIVENKELEERLKAMHKDRMVVVTIFEEFEEEHEKALDRIDVLENELQDLKKENIRLYEHLEKSLWDYKARDNEDENVPGVPPIESNNNLPICSGSHKRRSSSSHGNPRDTGEKDKAPCTSHAQLSSRKLITDEVLRRGRIMALYRSLFSAVLSGVVGMIVWEAGEPCLPLIAALFCVVGMSLYSVVQFFTTMKNKPASDTVALLSINWFILGTLTSPTLPGVVDRILILMGFCT